MKDNILLDSNIFLYGFSDTDLKKHEIAKDILLVEISAIFLFPKTGRKCLACHFFSSKW